MKNLLLLVCVVTAVIIGKEAFANEDSELLVKPQDTNVIAKEKLSISFKELMSLDGNPHMLGNGLALSGDKGNGGDICENKIDIISADIERWIHEEGHLALVLSDNVSHIEYMDTMLTAIKTSKVTCIDGVITVEDREKMCVNFVDSTNTPLVICNREKLLASNINDKYKLIHHELAGIAGLESGSSEGDSHYDISNQITAYLERELVTRLAVKTVNIGSNFSQKEMSEAYRALSSCSEASTQNRTSHFNYVKIIAKADNLSLVETTKIYNKLNCVINDAEMLRIISSVRRNQTSFKKTDLIEEMLRYFVKMKTFMKHPDKALADSAKDIIGAITIAEELSEPFDTYVDIFTTADWITAKYNGTYKQYDDNVKVEELLGVYKLIWGINN